MYEYIFEEDATNKKAQTRGGLTISWVSIYVSPVIEREPGHRKRWQSKMFSVFKNFSHLDIPYMYHHVPIMLPSNGT